VKKTSQLALRVVLLYSSIAGFWIICSDQVTASFVHNPTLLTEVHTVNGLVFVIVLGGFLFLSLRNHLQKWEKEKEKEAAVAQSEKQFSDTMIESMPGVLYFYNQQGRFLRWNRNMEIVSGYSGKELGHMQPLDFFAEADKKLLAERIGEVFEKGTSFVEAALLAKNGSSTPYFFTGRRLMHNGEACLVGMGIDVTERKLAEKALKESEQKFRALFEQAPLGIALIDSTTGQFLKLNPQYCKIIGYSESEILGLTFQRITHSDDIQNDLENLRCLREDRQRTVQQEKRYIRKDGSVVWISLTCVPLGDVPGAEQQHIAMVEDITERKQAEDRLAENERKYRELVEFANSIILRWNSEGQITFLNEFGQRFFGYSAEEIIGRHVIGTIVPETESAGRDLKPLIAQICADPKAFEQNINENICRDGRRVSIAWTNKIVSDEQGRVVEILSVGTDITERQRAQEKIRELNASLEQRVIERTEELRSALVRAESADRLKSAFLATMSHELRTPLNSIIGFTGVVLQGLTGPLNPEQAKQLGMVRLSARHLLALINDVLDLSKIEAGQIEIRTESFNLRDSLERVTAMVKPLAEKKGLTLTMVEPPELGEMSSDRRRVEQILLNLLNNAIKFTERGGVTLTAELVNDFRSPSGVGLSPAVRLRVTDTGIGIKPENMKVLFQPFRQIDTGLARQHEGTGLGLAICRRLAGLLGGEIAVKSEWSKGSEFSVSLPLGRPSNP
jgi:PAS domain S-box-containing protein